MRSEMSSRWSSHPAPVDERLHGSGLVGLAARTAGSSAAASGGGLRARRRPRSAIARRASNAGAWSPSRICRRRASIVSRPRTAPGPVDDDAGLDVRVEHHRERVLERRPAVEQRRTGWPSPRSPRPRREVRSRRPSRSGRFVVVDHEQVANGVRERAARGVGRVVADLRRGRRPERSGRRRGAATAA